MKLSVIILTKDAQDVLIDCLESVKFADEIIIVDNGSTDKTLVIAKEKKAIIITGIDDNFAENRNKGLQKAKGEWVLYIDSDERISPSLRDSIKNKVLSIKEPEFAAFKIQRKNFYLGNNPWPKIEKLERLFLRSKLQKWIGKLHESPVVNGEIGQLDGYLLHYTHRDLASMLDKTIAWAPIEAKLRVDAHHPKIVVWRLIRVMATGFWNTYISQGGWRVGTMGFIESIYQSYSMFITYATLWEMQNSSK